MEGTENGKSNGETQINNEQDSFVWDDYSQLYFHPRFGCRSGFYHDPNAGWYYSTSDGLYYKFEDGNYILLDSDKDCHQGNHALNESTEQVTCGVEYDQNLDKQENTDHIECRSNEVHESHPPPSEWLEDTLIELYLSGYSTLASNTVEPLCNDQDGVINGSMLSTEAINVHHLQRDSEFSSDHQAPTTSSATDFDEETSWEEECWRAQYGQVVHQEDELKPECPFVDIWDWSVDQKIRKEGNSVEARLLGKLVKPSSSFHPSITSQGRCLKTAPICRVHHDFVQVRSGQVYKLRTPNVGYLATLSSFDASNPTKDWGFPELSNEDTLEKRESNVPLKQNKISSVDRLSTSKKHKTQTYRDRAAERRSFHKEFGGDQGDEPADEITSLSPHGSETIEEAAAEALDMSLGAASYAQKILKNMGWKQGQGLGKTQQGVREPVQGTGNKGTAGLGWPSGRCL